MQKLKEKGLYTNVQTGEGPTTSRGAGSRTGEQVAGTQEHKLAKKAVCALKDWCDADRQV